MCFSCSIRHSCWVATKKISGAKPSLALSCSNSWKADKNNYLTPGVLCLLFYALLCLLSYFMMLAIRYQLLHPNIFSSNIYYTSIMIIPNSRQWHGVFFNLLIYILGIHRGKPPAEIHNLKMRAAEIHYLRMHAAEIHYQRMHAALGQFLEITLLLQ